MPKYTFTCDQCNESTQHFTHVDTTIKKCSCGGTKQRQLPVIGSPQVSELIDDVSNIRWKQNQNELVLERKEDYYWSKVVPKLVQKHDLETSLTNKWVYFNEQGELKVYNKPPGKR